VQRPALEVADIFREHGPAWRQAQRGHLSLVQLKVMSAITQCRTAALGGHVLRCGGCGTDQISYNSCRNRHCPKCQSAAAQRWLDARQADLLPVEYYHVVFTLPAPVADIAYTNKAAVYGLLFDMAAEVLQIPMPMAGKVEKVQIVGSVATSTSVAASKEWTWMLRNHTQAVDLFSATPSTATVVSGVGGGELAANATYNLAANQNKAVAAGDVLRLTIGAVGSPTAVADVSIRVTLTLNGV
jgi:hypothetical protein